MRQVIHNLLQNAQGRPAATDGGETREPVLIQTQWRPATQSGVVDRLRQAPAFRRTSCSARSSPMSRPSRAGLAGLPLSKKSPTSMAHASPSATACRTVVVLGAQVSLLIPASDQPLPQDRGGSRNHVLIFRRWRASQSPVVGWDLSLRQVSDGVSAGVSGDGGGLVPRDLPVSLKPQTYLHEDRQGAAMANILVVDDEHGIRELSPKSSR